MSLTFYPPIPHGANHPHTAPPPSRLWPQLPYGIVIGTLNIWDGQGFSLAQAIKEVERGVFDVMLLTNMKISTTAYFWN